MEPNYISHYFTEMLIQYLLGQLISKKIVGPTPNFELGLSEMEIFTKGTLSL
jgi:hypothetical protein